MDVISTFAGEIPILGVCLGHQCIGEVYGARTVSAPTLMHGKTSQIHHDATGVFASLPDPFVATRYGVVMGLRHRTLAVEGVQFHPESILTPCGPTLLRNFLGQLAA